MINKYTIISINLSVILLFSWGLLEFISEILLIPVSISVYTVMLTGLVLMIHQGLFGSLYKGNYTNGNTTNKQKDIFRS